MDSVKAVSDMTILNSDMDQIKSAQLNSDMVVVKSVLLNSVMDLIKPVQNKSVVMVSDKSDLMISVPMVQLLSVMVKVIKDNTVVSVLSDTMTEQDSVPMVAPQLSVAALVVIISVDLSVLLSSVQVSATVVVQSVNKDISTRSDSVLMVQLLSVLSVTVNPMMVNISEPVVVHHHLLVPIMIVLTIIILVVVTMVVHLLSDMVIQTIPQESVPVSVSVLVPSVSVLSVVNVSENHQTISDFHLNLKSVLTIWMQRLPSYSKNCKRKLIRNSREVMKMPKSLLKLRQLMMMMI
ncbi:predicted protein [Candida tropicalis MYA-3404]|uniref:Uncharacterized protein n=1 Tax=Candida tropicalis (strain ATCC MYA-3404 / T1) TaxID=294747 RepID=C5MB17_CANTT|nr:predicted protein [Candida tropicalis MYA-3404]EER32834.1 predicted protein [Candida tropicalis MYA-3404]KAG4406661.1 hypothetical protein JTP64_004045 [Candida tropicalis]